MSPGPLLENLHPQFRVKADFVIKRAAAEGVRLEPFWTLRTPQEQARLWSQSRSPDEKRAAVRKLREEGAVWLARILDETPPCYGRWETNNLPGQSWHQWGEAVDLRIVSETGRTIWNPNHHGYELLAQIAKKVNLTAGFFWKIRDAVHVQLRPDAVRAYYVWSDIDRTMQEKFHVQDQLRSANG